MQDQWFGDKNDYLKYSVIQHLMVDGDLKVAVNWMWNSDHVDWNCSKRRFLKDPDHFRQYDPEVFDYLVSAICEQGLRSVSAMANAGPIVGAFFHAVRVPVQPIARTSWSQGFLDAAAKCAVVFFDPDTGIVRDGISASRCNEFVLWDELEQAYGAGHSLLSYQHRARGSKRERAARERAQEVKKRLGVDSVYAIYNGEVALLIVPQTQHAESIQRAVNRIASSWAGEASVIWV